MLIGEYFFPETQLYTPTGLVVLISAHSIPLVPKEAMIESTNPSSAQIYLVVESKTA